MSARANLADQNNLSEVQMLIYLYCLTNKVPELSRPVIEMKAGSRPLLDGMAGKEVKNLVDRPYFVEHQGLYAVASKVKENEFSEANLKKNLTDFEWIRAKASIHEKVIEGVMKNACVIPFKLGTIFNTEDNLRAMLDGHAQAFKQNFRKLEGKEEWGLKVYCDLEKLKSAIGQEEAKILKMVKEIDSASCGKAYLLKKKKEQLLKDTLTNRINEYGQKSFEILKALSLEARINKLLPKEVTERHDEMILNSAFLVDKDKVTNLIQAVDRLKAKYNDKGINFDFTGPWPPYNFCSLSKEKAQSG